MAAGAELRGERPHVSFGLGFEPVEQDVGLDAGAVDLGAVGQADGGDRRIQRSGRVFTRQDALRARLAEGALTDEGGAAVVLKRAGEDLRR